MIIKLYYFLMVCILGGSQLFAAETGVLKVFFNNLRNLDGTIYVSVYDDASAFPMKAEKALVSQMVSANTQVVVFDNLPFGDYAISVFHDENANGKMEAGLFGIPKEGVGASNNKMGFGPPSFKDAVLNFYDQELVTTIDVKYF